MKSAITGIPVTSKMVAALLKLLICQLFYAMDKGLGQGINVLGVVRFVWYQTEPRPDKMLKDARDWQAQFGRLSGADGSAHPEALPVEVGSR